MVACLLLPVCAVVGQVTQQTFALQQGWNAVHLEVNPSPSDPNMLFAGAPFTSVWERYESPLVDGPPPCAGPDDPNCPSPLTGGWLAWLPPGDPGSVVNTLRMVRGGRVLLIKSSVATSFTVAGTPDAIRAAWLKGYNLGGFHVVTDMNQAPTFTAYLAPAQGLASATIYLVKTDGTLFRVASPATTRIVPGRGYWVRATVDAGYDGPLGIDSFSLGVIDYSRTQVDHTLTLENLAAASRSVSVNFLPSVPAPPGLPTIAGDCPLTWLDYGQGSNVNQIFQDRPLGSTASTLGAFGAANPRPRRTMKISVHRNGLSPAMADSNGGGSQYGGLLEITDGAGFRRLLGVAAQVIGGAGQASTLAGLWVGEVRVTAVAWTNAPLSGDSDSSTPRPVANAFRFPVIMHRNSAGQVKLLTEVTLLFSPGSDNTPVMPGHYVLASPACTTCGALQAGSIVDGEPFARRISTAFFSFDGDLGLTGSLAVGGNLQGAYTISANSKLNPFRHSFHPDHDNKDRFGQPTIGEIYEPTRTFSFAFDTMRPTGVVESGFGDTLLTGTYSETVTHLHKDPINARGTFELKKISSVALLNDTQ